MTVYRVHNLGDEFFHWLLGRASDQLRKIALKQCGIRDRSDAFTDAKVEIEAAFICFDGIDGGIGEGERGQKVLVRLATRPRPSGICGYSAAPAATPIE